jgi:hypothetical protein
MHGGQVAHPCNKLLDDELIRVERLRIDYCASQLASLFVLFLRLGIMRFLRSVALLGCAASVLSKPIRPLILPRQDGAPLSAEQTICGDLIVATKQGRAPAKVKSN